ncbi:GNAT family N-acetyltransferase [Massilia norwichensis]|uniref:GNAT family N-acetyltransferase n=1 Tax=Massilia norwichensis TaxID=1442366 RepID=A0ABT2A5X0_9BURK|nr:GNAT family N-acetyltransferase [Massilia norwichensis]MCS0589578.1 GNAT family N-acetyltransferase [Massilia norwichensis]
MALHWSDALDGVDWKELSEVIRLAPLGTKEPALLRTAFTNSLYRCFVYDDGSLVGTGRVLGDGVDAAYLCDVAILPSHQGRGLGKAIVARLVEQARGHRKIILYAVPGKEAFYARFGFRRMSTAMAIFDDPELAGARGYIAAD